MPDIINALFELLGALMVLDHCRAIRRDKSVAGLSVASVVFFSVWGAWNLYYYPQLGQWWSLAGAVVIFFANTVWAILLIKYRRTSNG